MNLTTLQKNRIAGDGVDVKWFQQKDQFLHRCPCCFEQFSNNIVHNLLQCGHFCCSECLSDGICGVCKKPKVLKKANYRGILDLKEDKPPAKFYNIALQFSTTTKTKKTKILSQISSSATFQQVLNMSVDFQALYDAQKHDKMLIVIEGKSLFYGQIKKLAIGQSRLLASNHDTTILIASRLNGGNEK